MAYVITPQSVASIQLPVLLITADDYIRAPKPLDSGVETLHLPHQRLPHTGHFDVLPLCQPQAAAVLAEEGEEFLCESPPAERAAIHQLVVNKVIAFLRQNRIIAE